jgi:hypothetical protein
MSSPEPSEEKLQRFGRVLRDAEEKRRIFVPPTVDETILKQARKHFREEAKTRPVSWWKWVVFAGAAALIAMALFISPRRNGPAFAREDFNGDGQVDILDAFALAKQLEAGGVDKTFDQNGDGKTDDADVRAIASAAVRLDRKS